MNSHSHSHDFVTQDPNISKNAKRTLLVVILTAVMMVIEVVAGYLTGSMALLADGWHMASHAAALGISVIAYQLAQSKKWQEHFSFGAGKMIPLGGYTSAIVLALIAILMAYESIMRLITPQSIQFDQAIWVAVIGLIVNAVSVLILHDKGHHHHSHGGHNHHHHDHNLKGAYLHVLADTLTSLLAIVALLVGKYYQQMWMDPVMGIVGSLIILKWGYGLCKETAWELLDGHAKAIDKKKIIEDLENQNSIVHDLHVWRIAPNAYASELIVSSSPAKGTQFYRQFLHKEYNINHVIVEEVS